ncbi:uncharacterized protein [Equus asinus]|uniref:uncharacterized protein isoform X1 n=1 Tax=Equus asinus TaxID=9793 RepID=UPI0038F61D0F
MDPRAESPEAHGLLDSTRDLEPPQQCSDEGDDEDREEVHGEWWSGQALRPTPSKERGLGEASGQDTPPMQPLTPFFPSLGSNALIFLFGIPPLQKRNVWRSRLAQTEEKRKKGYRPNLSRKQQQQPHKEKRQETEQEKEKKRTTAPLALELPRTARPAAMAAEKRESRGRRSSPRRPPSNVRSLEPGGSRAAAPRSPRCSCGSWRAFSATLRIPNCGCGKPIALLRVVSRQHVGLVQGGLRLSHRSLSSPPSRRAT